MRRTTALLLAGLLAGVTLTACGGSGPAPGGGPIATDQAQYNPQPYESLRDGGTLTTSITEVNPQFNQWQTDSTVDSLSLWRWYNPMLITFTPEGRSVFNPDYLTDVKAEQVEGNTRVTYTINPKATYNDGTPIDWRSFETTWRANNGKDTAYLVSSSDGYDRITSVTRGSDDRQAVVTFKGINLWWESLYNLLLHPKVGDAQTYNQGYLNNPHNEWGAGPYQVDRFDKQNGTISFVRNPKWWGKRGKLDSRTFITMETPAAVNAFKNGQLDAAGVGTKDYLAQVQGMKDIDIRRSVDPSQNLFTLNGQSPVLADQAVRRSVMQAVDRKQIQAIHFQGLGFDSPLPGSMGQFYFQEGYQDNFSKVVTFNPDEARRGLDAAGWAPGPDGVRVKDGKPLEFAYVNTGEDSTGKAVAAALAAMLKDVGVRLTIRQVPSSDFSSVINSKKFDMFYSAVAQSDPFSLAYICQTWCSYSTLMKSGVNSPTLDPEIQRINTLPTAAEQYAAANEVETKAFATYGIMPTIYRPRVIATKAGLANYGAGRFFTTSPEYIGWQK